MPTNTNPNDSLVISYLTLRKWVGFLGILLPFVLMAGACILGNCGQVQASISHYYYTIMGTYFTGTLCAVALFLFSYNGYDTEDKITGNLAAVFALVVAFFPTDSDPASLCQFIDTHRVHSVNSVHYTAAALLFSCFAWFSLRLFTKSKNTGSVTPEKIIRNRIYKICGVIIIICILGIGIYNFVDDLQTKLAKLKPVLIFESIALVAFGTSWVIKGEFILKDG